jgi:hypothetical protein
VRLEEKAAAAYATRIEALLREKQQELKAHSEIEPAKVEQPGEVSAEQKAAFDAVAASLENERAVLNAVDAEMTKQQQQQQQQQMSLAEKVALAREVEGKIDNFESEYARLDRETAPDLEKLGLQLSDILSLSVEKSAPTTARDNLATEKAVVDAALDDRNAGGFPAKKTACLARIAHLQDQLDAPNKRF